MSQFRYDVVLRVDGDRATTPPDLEWLDWDAEQLSLPAIRERLSTGRPRELGVRGVPNARVCAAVESVRLLAAGEREVSTQQLGELVMRELKKLDKVAYIRFASVYRNFEDVDAFSKAIREVSPTPRKK